MTTTTFDVDGFVESCRSAVACGDGMPAIVELVERAVAHRGWIERTIGSTDGNGIRFLWRDPSLTVYATVIPAGNAVEPHDHQLWAVAGLAGGAEQNVLFVQEGDDLREDRVLDLGPGSVACFEPDLVHGTRNPALTAAVHVYGGDLMATPRSGWDWSGRNPHSLTRLPAGGVDDANRWAAELHAAKQADARPRP